MTATTFGAVRLDGNTWKIDCEPHVRARLRRVFPRIPQWGGAIGLLDTPENSRELHWFLSRYPMELGPGDVEHLTQRAREHADQEQRLADILAARVEALPFDLAKPPREYQRLPATLMQVRGGLLLADDVGVGKTVSAICPMTRPDHLPALVVVPANLPGHWQEKLAEFAPSLRVHTISTGRPYPLVRQPRQRRPDLWDTLPDVIICSYHKLRGWADTLAQVVRYVVFEECQQLRRDGTGIYAACEEVARAVPRRMGLSATPIYNYGGEFFNVVDVLLPDALGERQEFMREWCSEAPGNNTRLQDPEQFGAWLRREGVMLRRTRRDVGRELPPVTVVPHVVESDSDALDALGADAEALARLILQEREDYRGQKMQASGEFDMLVRQATGVGKAPYVAEFVRMLVESGERVLLFGWHREVYRIWLRKLEDLGVAMYTGSESQAEKAEAKRRFVEGEAQVLIMSLRSGAGVDGLQHVCRTVVFGEFDWSPGVHEQCVGRVDRDGQKDPVMAYYLEADEGSDPIVIDVLGVKRSQSEGVRNPGGPLAERIDLGERALKRVASNFLRKRGAASTEIMA